MLSLEEQLKMFLCPDQKLEFDKTVAMLRKHGIDMDYLSGFTFLRDQPYFRALSDERDDLRPEGFCYDNTITLPNGLRADNTQIVKPGGFRVVASL